ncbi:hypothetical protein HYH02_012306 [Chlamydomonas schloesseri]|uniref:Uncharacterized protein n=1 Tax=Chlamydomonas schloesseri TaxID=2026947 RepID=A0A835SZT4_9CHLO|nr:hypothetical protein HYH02_012306 [Chlamydomonas schloesseri]|eukprot:KAG2434477.1 hypothetical protein HYH02_012306 [Chlamydomonas schloesseri]
MQQRQQEQQQRQQEQQQAEQQQQQQQAGQQQEEEPQEQQQGPLSGRRMTLAQPKAVPFLAGAAAAGGHVELLEQLLPRLEPAELNRATRRMLFYATQHCPLGALQLVCRHLFNGQMNLGASAKQTLAVAAATSPSPDWEAKLDWVLLHVQMLPGEQLPGHPHPLWFCARNAGDEGGEQEEEEEEEYAWRTDASALMGAAGALPDWLQRLQALRARRVPLPPLPGLTHSAACAGDVAALRWLLEQQRRDEGRVLAPGLMFAAASGGHPSTLAALRELLGLQFSSTAVHAAAEQGKAEAVLWLLEQEPLRSLVVDMEVADHVIRSDASLGTLRRLHARGARLRLQTVSRYASVEALDWVLTTLPQDPMTQAVTLHSLQRSMWEMAVLSGNLAAADWMANLLSVNGLKPHVPITAHIADAMRVDGEHAFYALRWWLRQRQERGGAIEVEDIFATELEKASEVEGKAEVGWVSRRRRQQPVEGLLCGALMDADWRVLLQDVAASAFAAPESQGLYRFSRPQWDWLVAKRLEAAAAQATATAGAGQEQVQGAVAAARAEVEHIAGTARQQGGRGAVRPDGELESEEETGLSTEKDWEENRRGMA